MTSSSVGRLGLVLASILACGASSAARFQPGTVMLDGRFDDWAGVPVATDDPADAPGAAVDLGRLQLWSDDRWLYLAFETRSEVSAQSLPGTLRVLVDADGDESTGTVQLGMSGVDFVVDYSYVAAPVSPRGAGAAIWRTAGLAGREGPISPYALGLTLMPVHASRQFEMRMARVGSDVRLPDLGPSIRLKLAYVEKGDLVDETAVVAHRFETRLHADGPEAVERPLDWIRPTDDTLRIAHWNVAGASFRRAPADFARLLAAVRPDVLTLSELPGDVTAAEVQAFFERPILRALGEWQFVLGAAGGRQRSVVAACNLLLDPAPLLADIRYAPDALDRLRSSVPQAMASIVDLERARGVSSVGAWLGTTAGRFLVVALDLQSGGWVGSARDQLRVLQARTIRALIDDTLRESPAPLIIGGDLNLVGSLEPQRLLAAHRDSTDPNLVAVDARRLGERTLTTWRNQAQVFTPGRLDFLLVPPQATDTVRSFSLATDDLDPFTLEQLGLEAALSRRLSDHLIVVADLRLR